jgi:uncharacterized membrane protein
VAGGEAEDHGSVCIVWVWVFSLWFTVFSLVMLALGIFISSLLDRPPQDFFGV